MADRPWTPEWLADYEARQAGRIGAGKEHETFKERAIAKPLHEPIYPLIDLCRAHRVTEPIPEYIFAKPRKWRFDYAWPLQRFALEVDGGVWIQGRHNRGQGAINDQEKLSEAAILGWRVLYAIPDDLRNGVAIDRVLRALRPEKSAA